MKFLINFLQAFFLVGGLGVIMIVLYWGLTYAFARFEMWQVVSAVLLIAAFLSGLFYAISEARS